MTPTTASSVASARKTSDRWVHRRTCILAGGLAAAGGVLGLFVHPWFVALAAVGGVWLILAPEGGCDNSL